MRITFKLGVNYVVHVVALLPVCAIVFDTGELFKLGILHEAIIHSCIKEVNGHYA